MLGFMIGYESDTVGETVRFDGCGGNFTTKRGILTSPTFPDTYPGDQDCTYSISAPVFGSYVNISFLTIDIHCEDISLESDYIELRDGSSEDSPLMGRFCGNGSNVPAFIQTTQNHMRIR